MSSPKGRVTLAWLLLSSSEYEEPADSEGGRENRKFFSTGLDRLSSPIVDNCPEASRQKLAGDEPSDSPSPTGPTFEP